MATRRTSATERRAGAEGRASQTGMIYARVSSKDQEREGFSIPAQLQLLRGYAMSRDVTVLKEFVDVETAKQAGRTGFGEMLTFMRRDKSCRILLVEKTDRLYRNLKDYVTLDDEHLFDMEFRDYQQSKRAPGAGSTGRGLCGSVALVTGAAGAIGSGICEALLAQGCHVAASDLPGAALDGLVEELSQRHPSLIVGTAVDVTQAASVAAGFAQVIRTWVGIDAVIVNAGIAHVAPLTELTVEAFRKLEAVNVEGTLLTLAEAGRHFALQRTGGDVVLVSTKNVFSPGAGFGAYSATKAASHQLARIASLEFAPLSVRVNMVAPDAVFSHGDKRSGLWATVGPGRMKARGLDERGLEEYYRSRNLLKAQVTSDHVARAVLFFLTHQTPTTGATIPVDGGLPDATPR